VRRIVQCVMRPALLYRWQNDSVGTSSLFKLTLTNYTGKIFESNGPVQWRHSLALFCACIERFSSMFRMALLVGLSLLLFSFSDGCLIVW
jgi:hypothetical protein